MEEVGSPEMALVGGDPPQNYKPLNVNQRQQWNGFLDYLKNQGQINLNDPQVGVNFLNQYKLNNPDFSITAEQIPFINYEQAQLRKGDSFGNINSDQLKQLRAGMSSNYLNANIPEVGAFTPETTKLYYPQFKAGNRDFGTNFEDYLKMKGGEIPPPSPLSAPAAQPAQPMAAPTATPISPSPPINKEALRKKYADNPYLMDQGRYNWGSKLDNEFPLTGGKVRDAVVDAAKFNHIDPALLYGSAMEEGMSGSVDAKYSGNASEAYVNWAKTNNDKAEEYPVDSFYNYGLDQFAGMAAALEKKGYLPKGFSDRFTTFNAENENGEKLKAAAFKKDSDALIAKSAMMRLAKDQLEEHVKKTGVALTPKQKDFFMLANYNGGEGNMRKMIQSYKEKGYLKDDKFLDTKFKPAAYGSIYKNVMARLQSAQQLRDEKQL